MSFIKLLHKFGEPCCEEAMLVLHHIWIVHDKTSYGKCKDCAEKIIGEAIAEGKDVRTSKAYPATVRYYMIDSYRCPVCYKFNNRGINCNCGG